MSKVIFQFSDGERVETEAYSQLNILAHGQIIEKNLQSRCCGHCVCSTCRVMILGGKVSEMRDEERKLLEKVTRGQVSPGLRLACQCFPENSDEDVTVSVPASRFDDARVILKKD